MIIHEMTQRSEEWYAVRLGKITATSFPTMANAKSKATLDNLCYKTAAEILTGVSCESDYTNTSMENGVTLEDQAVCAYENEKFMHVREVGFVELDEFIGGSPDGLVDDDGGIELKCPEPHTHLKYLSADGKAWKNYKWQVQGALWITGRDWWDFTSYCPLFLADKQLLIERVTPDAESFKKLADGADYCRKRIREILKIMDEKNGKQNVPSHING